MKGESSTHPPSKVHVLLEFLATLYLISLRLLQLYLAGHTDPDSIEQLKLTARGSVSHNIIHQPLLSNKDEYKNIQEWKAG